MAKQQWFWLGGFAAFAFVLTMGAMGSAAIHSPKLSAQLPVTPSQMTASPMRSPIEPSSGAEQGSMGETVTLPAGTGNGVTVGLTTHQTSVTAPVVTPSETTGSDTTAVPSTTVIATTTTAPTTTQSTTTAKPVMSPTPTTTAKPVTTTTPITTAKPVQSPAPDQGQGSWFDDVVFLGDSITAGLAIYAQNYKVLGNATFIATPSYSIKDAISSLQVSNPDVYYDGVAVRPEDGIALSGKSRVIIALGINDLCYGVDSTLTRYRELISNIQKKNPHVTIYIQSITPITTTCSIADKNLNNDNVRRYNEKLKAMCEELGLEFIDFAPLMYDESGEALKREYCRDPDTMGMHYSNAGYVCWVNYLTTRFEDSADEAQA